MLLTIVVPCFNESEVLPETTRQLTDILRSLVREGKICPSSCVLYVDDGSTDGTWSAIKDAARLNQEITGLKLSRNRGHQNALLAGLLHASGDAVISIDADLQDDVAAVKKMVEEYRSGSDIVYGVRSSRKTDSFFKRTTGEAYYRLLRLLGVDLVFNHADYRLLSRRAIEALRQYKEVNLFLRGVIPHLGFPSSFVLYERAERYAGESKYPLRKMLSFAWQGVTSFTAAPLRLITAAGLIMSFVSIAISIWALATRLFTDAAVPGWASTVVPIYLLGGIQLFCTGIIGEYLAKIYFEVKGRPQYFVEEVIRYNNCDTGALSTPVSLQVGEKVRVL